MRTICKVPGAECPHGLHICCGICEHSGTCDLCCDQVGMNSCSTCLYAEVINDELAHFESTVPDVIQNITNLMQMKKDLDEQEKQLKQKLLEAMEINNIKSFENEVIKMTYVAPTTRTTIDSIKLKKDHPDIAEQYSKTSNVSASVRVTLKGGA